MTDPISSGIALHPAATSLPPAEPSPKGASFDQMLRSRDQDPAAGDPLARPEPSHTDRLRMERELETRVLRLDRSEQTRYFAERIDASYRTYADLRTKLGQPTVSPAQRILLERLDRLGGEYSELHGFLRDFSSGKDFTQKELLAVQIRSHQILQSVEILSKTVEQSTSGLKTIFQTNV